ncbi:uncharacterized protein A4U43_C04F10360 [Asparagus officinalis]|uniref:Uncharacterized protein n=1 Tax=Asparagus officinalis TaxID=4686 RepID=A0A5P1F566_ASPOF|nr:uncharacterized protein A4U43_C04F10360 [Asparagus officinalis]
MGGGGGRAGDGQAVAGDQPTGDGDDDRRVVGAGGSRPPTGEQAGGDGDQPTGRRPSAAAVSRPGRRRLTGDRRAPGRTAAARRRPYDGRRGDGRTAARRQDQPPRATNEKHIHIHTNIAINVMYTSASPAKKFMERLKDERHCGKSRLQAT